MQAQAKQCRRRRHFPTPRARTPLPIRFCCRARWAKVSPAEARGEMDWGESFPAHPGLRMAVSVGGAACPDNYSDREAGLRVGRAVLGEKEVTKGWAGEKGETAEGAEGSAAKR